MKVKMPIEWLVLEERKGKSLVISKDVIDWEMYGSPNSISWNETYLYNYLKDCYEHFFTYEEKDAIVKGELGPLFILSQKEIVKYFPYEEDRRAVMYFVDRNEDGEINISIEHHSYWLRNDIVHASKGDIDCDPRDIAVVTDLGYLSVEYSDADEIGVRIAMWVDRWKAKHITAKKGYNPWHHTWDVCEY